MSDLRSPPPETSPETAPETLIGTVVDGRYRLDALLGRGGFGAVFRARHLALDHDVAIKLLLAGVDAHAAKRLVREAKILARLDHPNCVRVMDFGSYADAPYLVMELIEGKPLASLLGEPWTPLRAVDTAIELLAGLAHAHALGLVHRDLKPGNVLVSEDSRGHERVERVEIIDFGIVTLAAGERLGSFTEQLTATGKIVGTPRYMSPEQLLGGAIDGRSDLYALGLILYEMLAGQPPFGCHEPRELAWHHAVAQPPPLPDSVPDVLARFVEQLLAKKPERRPATAELASAQLQAIRPMIATSPAASRVATTTSNTLEQRIGRFLILRKLGEGGMGVVYLAYDDQLDRRVALKLVVRGVRDPRAGARLVREARGLARLAHPHVVPVFEIGEHQGALFVAMEYVPGRSLRAWLHERARTWTETLALIVQVGRGLAAAHALGLVHRDVKPDNVIVGDDGRARVLDFGLVRAASPALEMIDRLMAGEVRGEAARDALTDKLTRTGTILGTPAYMALEQLAGDEVDALTDQFAFCVLAFEALYGERPFASVTLDQLAAQLTAGEVRPRPAASHVPARVHDVLVRGLAVMPDSRWPSMAALLDALERAARLRTPWLGRALAAMVGGLALVVGAAWGFGADPSDDESRASEPSSAGEDRCDEALEARNLELARALDRSRASAAALRPTTPAAWVDTIELAARYRGAELPFEVRASLLSLGATVHEVHEVAESGEVVALAWSPGAPLLALARRERGILLWDASTREAIRTLDHEGTVATLEFSDEGALLVAREPTRATLWHVATGTSLGTIDEPGLAHVRFVPDQHALVLAGESGVSWWSLVAGRVLERGALVRPSGAVVELARVRASSGARMVTITTTGELATWSTEGDPLQRFDLDERAPILAARVATDGRRVALVSAAGPSLWDATSGEAIATPELDTRAIAEHGLGFSPDARHWIVGPRGRAPWIFDAQTGERRATIHAHSTSVHALAFDDTGRLLSLGDDAVVRALELESGRLDRIGELRAEPRALALGEGGRVATLDEQGAVQIWASTSVGRQVVLAPRDTRARALALAPGRVAWTDPQGVRLLDASSPDRPLESVVEHEHEVMALSLSPTGAQLVTLDAEGRVRAFDAATRELERELPASEPAWTRVVSLDDAQLISVDASGRIARWSTDSPTPRASWSAGGPVEAIAVEADADALVIATASGAWPARVTVWTGEGEPSLALSVEAEVRALAFSPDGRQLALAGVGPRVELWSLASATRTLVSYAEEAEVRALAFSPDSATLAIGGESVRVVDPIAGSVLATLAGPAAPIHTLAFSPDAAWLEVLRVDGSVDRQLVDEAALLVRLCQALDHGPLAGEIEPSCSAVVPSDDRLGDRLGDR